MLATAFSDPTLAEVFRPRTKIEADGTVEGYASLFGEIDAARDMVMPGAFAQTLRLRGPRRIPMLFQHDPAEPIGVWLELVEDHRGLKARGRLIPEVARGREVLALVRAGAIDGLSIGFRTVKGRLDPRTRVCPAFIHRTDCSMNAQERAWAERLRRGLRPDWQRYVRPDAERWIRPDAYRFMPPGALRFKGKDVVRYFWPHHPLERQYALAADRASATARTSAGGPHDDDQ